MVARTGEATGPTGQPSSAIEPASGVLSVGLIVTPHTRTTISGRPSGNGGGRVVVGRLLLLPMHSYPRTTPQTVEGVTTAGRVSRRRDDAGEVRPDMIAHDGNAIAGDLTEALGRRPCRRDMRVRVLRRLGVLRRGGRLYARAGPRRALPCLWRDARDSRDDPRHHVRRPARHRLALMDLRSPPSRILLLGISARALAQRIGRSWRSVTSCASVSVAATSRSTCSSEISARYAPIAPRICPR